MDVTVSASYDLSDLAVGWMELERRAEGGFFLSWRWIGSWLRVTGARPLLVKAEEAGRIAGLGLLVPSRRRRFLLSLRQLWLHETGRPEWDAVMIEHNNFLMARDAPEGLAASLFKALQVQSPAWDEIVLGGISPGVLAGVGGAGWTVVIDRVSPDFGVLLPAPGRGERWEERLSANQRAQLRQSRNFAERAGPLTLKAAADKGQALDYFEKMAALHTAYWQSRGKPGAFATPFSRAFHQAVITSDSDSAGVELLELSAGEEVLGYLYNFQYGDRVYSYQSGFAYGGDNRHRPGLLAHALAIERAQERGMRLYDFLAGDAPYKARLGQKVGEMMWCRLQKDRPLLRCERAARSLYRSVRR